MPFGSPASSASSASRTGTEGSRSLGLMMKALPEAIAGEHIHNGIIAVSMGAAGVLTRVLAPAFGAFLTYGSLDAEQPTAPGQIEARELRRLYRVRELGEKTAVT